ncbi:MAG: NAD(P)-dependent alcohol dehydrogenase [Capsulimonadaceae bacterium]|nr:NAD(P)-dependent alcohol dehydrogenase [Capsulimonadaceae bacterium]
MKAVVLERQHKISIREIDIPEPLGVRDVRIQIYNVGICGSDVHYYEHGRIGPFIVNEPMVLGHEASGTIIETGRDVTDLKVGDRVCMEPGIPDPNSRATREGIYNLDPAVRFWATPPIHGILRPTVVHPAAFTFKLPDNVSFAEGAMVEPLAVGMHGANKAQIRPGDVGVVIGAGPIGILTALSALAGGCSRIILADTVQPKLDLSEKLGPIVPVNVSRDKLSDVVAAQTGNWGADIVFECSGNPRAGAAVFETLRPGGAVVFIGMMPAPISYDVVGAQIKEARVEHVFRYAHVYPRSLALMGSGKIDVKPLITDTFAFADSVRAFDFALKMPPTSVKAQIVVQE